jgi:hypothetical protein
MSYPPEPWYLGGSLLVSVFRVPTADLPPEFTAGPKPRTVGRHTIVGAAFARYQPGGVLAYDELLVATPTLDRGRLRVTIPQIWVNSPESLEGGRALWGIPKQLGGFDRADSPDPHRPDAASVAMVTDDGPVASLEARLGRTLLPGMRQLALPILQSSPTARILSHNRVIGRIRALSPTWTFDPHGPLGYLAGHRPFVSFALGDASIIFGMDVQRS